MQIFRTIAGLQNFLQDKNAIGFVPTMGALHEGHLQLVKKSIEQNNCSIVSIFVNPSQFNDSVDFEKYPRNEERDLELLTGVLGENDVVFLPSVEEMCGKEKGKRKKEKVDKFEIPENLKHCMCGRTRPGHFEGVVSVVGRFLEILSERLVTSDQRLETSDQRLETSDQRLETSDQRLETSDSRPLINMYLGEKDYQQLKILQDFVAKCFENVEVVACPTVRESDGLAMSSRNVRLSKESRVLAANLFKIMTREIEQAISDPPVPIRAGQRLAVSRGPEILHFVQNDCVKMQNDIVVELLKFEKITIDYVEIRDAEDLREISEKTKKIIIASAIFVDGVRLIDNVFLELRTDQPDMVFLAGS